MTLAVGILVGGRGSRLGGVAKGLLPGKDQIPIIEHLLAEIDAASPDARVYLLGSKPEYAHLHLPQLQDKPENVGPLGGLNALLHTGADEVVLLGCDMPFVTRKLLRRLLAAPCRAAVAAKADAVHFEPLFSRFNVHATLPVVERLLSHHRYSVQGVLMELGPDVLTIAPEEAAQLRDWDTPEDIVAG